MNDNTQRNINKFFSAINNQATDDIQQDIKNIYYLLQHNSFQKYAKKEALRIVLKKASFCKCCKMIIKYLLYNKRFIYYDSRFITELQDIQKNILLLKLAVCTEKELYFPGPFSKYELPLEKNKNTFPNLHAKGYIAILVNSLDIGGLEQVVAHLARGIKQLGVPLEIWCLYSGGLIADSLSAEGISIRIFSGKKRQLYKYAKKNPPMLINSHYSQLNIAPFQKMHIPVVEVIHNMYVVQGKKFFKAETKKYNACQKIVAVSALAKETYVKKLHLEENKNNEKIVVIGNSAQLKSKELTIRNDVCSSIKIESNSFVFINVASIDSRKNQLSLIDAFDIVCSVVTEKTYLILIGNVLDPEYNKKIQDKILKCQHKENIRLLPYSNDIQSFYQISDVFIMNSFYEGWSISATEAIHFGLPLIHSECGSAVELTQKGKYGIMISNPLPHINEMMPEEVLHCMSHGIYYNLEELTTAMLKMINSKNELRKYRSAISHSALNEFNETNMIMDYLTLFDTLVSSS